MTGAATEVTEFSFVTLIVLEGDLIELKATTAFCRKQGVDSIVNNG